MIDDDEDLPKKVVLMTISTPPSEQQGQQVLTTLSVKPISRFWTSFSRKFIYHNSFFQDINSWQPSSLNTSPHSGFFSSSGNRFVSRIWTSQASPLNQSQNSGLSCSGNHFVTYCCLFVFVQVLPQMTNIFVIVYFQLVLSTSWVLVAHFVTYFVHNSVYQTPFSLFMKSMCHNPLVKSISWLPFSNLFRKSIGITNPYFHNLSLERFFKFS